MNPTRNWKVQAALATTLGVLGLFIMLNPVTIVSAAGSLIPWLLLVGAGIQVISIMLRSRRRFRVVIGPALLAVLLAYAGLSMKFGDPATIGPISLVFVLGLLLIGSAGAKMLVSVNAKRSKYFNFILGSAVLSAILGAVVFFNWSVVSVSLIGVFIGLELIADGIAMAALALRERDGEEALEALGLDPVAEAAKAADAARAAEAARSAAAGHPPEPLLPILPEIAVPAIMPTVPEPSPSLSVMQEAQLGEPESLPVSTPPTPRPHPARAKPAPKPATDPGDPDPLP